MNHILELRLFSSLTTKEAQKTSLSSNFKLQMVEVRGISPTRTTTHTKAKV